MATGCGEGGAGCGAGPTGIATGCGEGAAAGTATTVPQVGQRMDCPAASSGTSSGAWQAEHGMTAGMGASRSGDGRQPGEVTRTDCRFFPRQCPSFPAAFV